MNILVNQTKIALEIYDNSQNRISYSQTTEDNSHTLQLISQSSNSRNLANNSQATKDNSQI